MATRLISADIMLKENYGFEVQVLFDSYNSILCVNIPDTLSFIIIFSTWVI